MESGARAAGQRRSLAAAMPAPRSERRVVTGLLVSEFTSLYESYRQGERSRLAELEVQYADFAVWQREWLQGEVLQQQIDYWKRSLPQLPVLELPTDRRGRACRSTEAARSSSSSCRRS